jgi:hypothetical protein
LDPFLVHGIMMAIAWLVLLPAGVLIARFFKVTRNQDWPNQLDSQLWWLCHRWLNYTGIGLATLGALLIWTSQDGPQLVSLHGQLGLSTLALGWLQVISGWLRGTKGGPTDAGADPADPSTWRGDHFDMTPRRRLFEAWHKHVGYLALMLAVPSVWLGLMSIAAPAWLQALPWLAALVFAGLFLRFRLEGRWVDTHAAIWGPKAVSSSHPDNPTKREVS